MKNKPPTPKEFNFLKYSKGKIIAAMTEFDRSPGSYPEKGDKLRISLIRDLHRELKQDLKEFEGYFQEELFTEDENKWPKKWMIQDTIININLERTQFNNIINYIWKISTIKMTKAMQEFIPKNNQWVQETTEKGELVERDLVLFYISPIEAARELNIREVMIKQYLSIFSKIGIIQKIADGRGRSKKPTIYSVGTWVVAGEHTYRKSYLHKSPEWIIKLREFKTRG